VRELRHQLLRHAIAIRHSPMAFSSKGGRVRGNRRELVSCPVSSKVLCARAGGVGGASGIGAQGNDLRVSDPNAGVTLALF
jgi:hypothetical protein